MNDEKRSPTLAGRLFENRHIESEVDNALMFVFGATPWHYSDGTECPEEADTATWPCSHMVYDDYDNSFELWGCKPDWVPTEEQYQAALALGFSRGWFCYTDGQERYGTGSLHPSSLPRTSESTWLAAKRQREIDDLKGQLATAVKIAATEFDRTNALESKAKLTE